MTKLCAVITEPTIELALRALRALPAGADMAELRLDYLRDADVGDFKEEPSGSGKTPALRSLMRCGKPVICTCRPQSVGGRFEGSERDRLEILAAVSELGAEYVDVEIEDIGDYAHRGNAKKIVSYHNFENTPPDLDSIFRRIESRDPDVVKVATTATDITDNARMFAAMRKCGKPAIGLCMGERGAPSRILAPKFGGFLTFASLDGGKESAPGQITLADLLKLYRFRQINEATEIYGVVANPVAHSMSPAIHNAAFAALGINAVYLFLRVDNVAAFIEAFRQIDAKGYSVTIPHKESVIPCMDEVTPEIRRIGAMNTVVNRGGRLYGYNTDLKAALGSLANAVVRAGMAGSVDGAFKGKRVLMLGAGGAARIITYGLMQAGADVTIVNRTQSRSEQLARDMDCAFAPVSEIINIPYDILVNGTSIGMSPKIDETPMPAEGLRPGAVVFDDVYNPIETRLLREAREKGCVTVSGFEWFVGQAAAQFELWTGRAAPRELMADVVRKRLTEK
ncbi:MAG TPA: shikimate dehydrogenase [Candidatus Brocadiia bacterium]|nr:shikimate dehydrogenase [Candidatus Brocadiia bacterium]